LTCFERPCNRFSFLLVRGTSVPPTPQCRRSAMAVITRETLVLRGVSVLRDGLTVVRLGSGYRAVALQQTPAPIFTMRHPQPFNPAEQPDAERWADAEHRDASSRAGRPEGRTVGVLNRVVLGGSSVPAARSSGQLSAGAAASADKIDSRTRGRLVGACPAWQGHKPGQTARLTTSTGSTRWGPAGDRMS